jgi:hypothetical protein
MHTKLVTASLLAAQLLLLVGYLSGNAQAGVPEDEPIVGRTTSLMVLYAEHGLRSLEDDLETHTPPINGGSSFQNESGEKTKPNVMNFGFLLPLVSMSCAVWFVRKHGRECCSCNTVIDDAESIPSQIEIKQDRTIKEHTKNIELQNVMISRLEKKRSLQDPVDNLSMLNHSDWTGDEQSEDLSFSWVENGSTTIGYFNMNA